MAQWQRYHRRTRITNHDPWSPIYLGIKIQETRNIQVTVLVLILSQAARPWQAGEYVWAAPPSYHNCHWDSRPNESRLCFILFLAQDIRHQINYANHQSQRIIKRTRLMIALGSSANQGRASLSSYRQLSSSLPKSQTQVKSTWSWDKDYLMHVSSASYSRKVKWKKNS